MIKSIVANIEPMDDITISSKRTHHSSRSGGSFIQLLKKPTKYVESTRSYVTGDPVNFIDWKIYARTENLILRENRDESSSFVKIAVDLGETMDWPSKEDKSKYDLEAANKLEVALRLALNLAYGHAAKGDFVDIVLKDGTLSKSIRIKSSGEVLALFNRLLKENFSKQIVLEYAVESKFLTERKFKVEYWISDFITADLDEGFSSSKFRFALHLLSRLECKIDWVSNSSKYSESNNTKIEYDGKTLLNQYSGKFNKWIESIELSCKTNEYNYICINDDMPTELLGSKLLEAIS